jgi:ketosteroid isomerase-like protein
MSQQNVDRVREAFDRFRATGEPELEGLHPEIEVHDHDIPDAEAYRGREGFRRWLGDWGDAFGEFNMEPERWIDAGDRVVCVFRIRAKGRGSGVEVERRDAMVWTVHDGATVRIDYYNNEAQALEAAGVAKRDAGAGTEARGNVDVVRSVYAAWERGDFSETGWLHPDFEFARADGLAAGTRSGQAGMAEAWREWLSAWEGFSVQAERYVELDGDRVLVLAHFRGRGKASGLDVGQTSSKGASLFHLREGRVAKLVLYTDARLALEELGLAQRDGPA